jgi:hypothetical protein
MKRMNKNRLFKSLWQNLAAGFSLCLSGSEKLCQRLLLEHPKK